MATELNLHHAFYEAFNEPTVTNEGRALSLEKARLWYLLYVLDHMSSITFGRPACMSEMRPIKDLEMLLTSQYCTDADQALIAQVQGLVVLSRAFDHFGLEPKRTMSGDDASVLNHMRFVEDTLAWKQRWLMHQASESYLRRSVEIHYHFSNLVLNSLVLRGRSLDKISDLPSSLRPLALKAVEAAHQILQHFLSEPGYYDDVAGMPLYLHSMIAFAVVFLMKMSTRWHAIGITISPAENTIPLVEQVIRILQNCKAGANHMVFKMAKGFERMLKQLRTNNRASQDTSLNPMTEQSMSWTRSGSMQQSVNGMTEQAQRPYQGAGQAPQRGYGAAYSGSSVFDHNVGMNTTGISSETNGSAFANWGFQDDDLWQVGMGWDLLDPSGMGPASVDFTYPGAGSTWY